MIKSYKNMTSLLTRIAPLMDSLYDIKIEVMKYNIISINEFTFYNALEAETIGNIVGLEQKIRNLCSNNNDLSILNKARSDAEEAFLIEGRVQYLINTNRIENADGDMYIVTKDSSVEMGDVTKDLKIGTKVVLLKNTSNIYCGFYYKEKTKKAVSYVPDLTIIAPIRYSMESNPILYFRKMPFTNDGRSKKNIISDVHADWIKSRLAISMRVDIRCLDGEFPALMDMLVRAEVLQDYKLISVNRKPILSFVNEDDALTPMERHYFLVKVATRILDYGIVKDIELYEKIGARIFSDRVTFFGSYRHESIVSNLIKMSINKVEDCTPMSILEEMRKTSFYSVGCQQKGKDAFDTLVKKASARTISNLKGKEILSGQNYSIGDSNSSTIIGIRNSFEFHINRRRHFSVFNIGDTSSLYDMDKLHLIRVAEARRRHKREASTKESILNNLMMVMDEDNAVKCRKLIIGIIASFILDVRFSVSIKNSTSERANIKFKEFLLGSYINGIAEIVYDNQEEKFAYIEKRNILISNKKIDSISTIVMSNDCECDIDILGRMNNATKKSDLVLTGRSASIPDSIEVFYLVGSMLSIKFSSIDSAVEKFNEVGVFEFVDYLGY